MIAKDDNPVLKVAQLSCMVGLPDCEMTFSALTSGFDLENHPPILMLVEVVVGLRKYWVQ